MHHWRLNVVCAAASIVISACSHVSAPTDAVLAITAPQTESIQTTALNASSEAANNEIEVLQEHVKLLEQNMFLMQEHMRAMQNQHKAMNQNIGILANNQRTRIAAIEFETNEDLPHDPTYSRAYAQYHQKQFQQAIQTLKPYSAGGNGSAEASNGMYLLMLSHKQLKQCESTINIGRQFQQRFPTHIRAAEALYSVGQCQYDMQQKDIARETWKRVRVLYPHSAAARMAAQQLR